MSKTKLNIPYQCFFKIFAISSSLKDYRVSYFINKWLDLNLEKVDNLIIDNKKKSEVYSFELQKDNQSNENFDYFLVNNKTIGKQLLNSLKGFDYLFLIRAEEEIPELPEILLALKAIEQFQLVLAVDNLSARDKNIIDLNIT